VDRTKEGGAGVGEGQEHCRSLQDVHHYRLAVAQPVGGQLVLDVVQEPKLPGKNGTTYLHALRAGL